MVIEEMAQYEIKDMLERATLGRLACVNGNKPYVVPMNFCYVAFYLYSFTTVGKKTQCMRSNPDVCVEFDEVSAPDRWQSVVVAGRYEELTEDSIHKEARKEAYALLSETTEWWQPAYVRTNTKEHGQPTSLVFFRISILETTGHKAVRKQPPQT